MSDEMQFNADDVVLRRFSKEDLSALVVLLQSVPEIAHSGDDISMVAMRAQLTWPGHTPERDRWVAAMRADPERLVGYCAIFKSPSTPRADMLLATHPTLRRHGIGSELLRRALVDAAALGAQDAACYVSERDTRTPEFLSRRGFTPVSAYVELSARPDQRFPAPQWPDGFTIRAWRDDTDLATLVEASNRCYEGLWGHHTSTAADWVAWLPALDTAGISFLFGPDGELVGMVRSELREALGRTVNVIDAPGVVSRWRRAGLYRPLLLHAIRWLYHRDPSEYRIESWGDDPSVIDEYQSLGFVLSRRDVLYRRRLSASVEPATGA